MPCLLIIVGLMSCQFFSSGDRIIGNGLGDRVTSAYENLEFNKACEEIFTLVRASNKYVDESAPWVLFKQKQESEVKKVLYAVLESVRLSAYLLSPIIPNLSSDIYKQLGFSFDFNNKTQNLEAALFSKHSQWGKLNANQNLGKARPIFSKLELPSEN